MFNHYCSSCGKKMKKVSGTKGVYRCGCGKEVNTKNLHKTLSHFPIKGV